MRRSRPILLVSHGGYLYEGHTDLAGGVRREPPEPGEQEDPLGLRAAHHAERLRVPLGCAAARGLRRLRSLSQLGDALDTRLAPLLRAALAAPRRRDARGQRPY